MSTLLQPLTITTALAAGVLAGPFQLAEDILTSILLEGAFVYGSGGATVDAWVQTSTDSGGKFVDIAQFHFTTASATKAFNLSSATPVTTELVFAAPGSLASDTCKDGILGPWLRVWGSSTGTYAGGTTLAVYCNRRLRAVGRAP